MSSNSEIEWTEKTWNPIAGCTKVSSGCLNCYAETEAARVLLRVSASAKSERGLETVEAYTRAVDPKRRRWTGRVGLMPGKLADPLKWKEPALVFVNSMSDLFHPDVPDDFVDQVFAVMALWELGKPRRHLVALASRSSTSGTRPRRASSATTRARGTEATSTSTMGPRLSGSPVPAS